MKIKRKNSGKNSRPLRVGEEIRHALSALLQHGGVSTFDDYGIPITVTEVRVSPDLRHATAYVMPLGGKRQQDIISALQNPETLREFRMAVAGMVKLQFVPNLRFAIDASFEQAEKIERLIRDSKEKEKSIGDAE